MATETKEKTEVIVTSNVKIVAALQSQFQAETVAQSKKVLTARVVKSEASRLAYDEKQARQMLSYSWREARNFTSKDVKEIADFDLRSRPDVSKVMALAFPADTKAGAQLEKAIAHNDKQAGKATRVSENRLLEIARGNLTFEGALEGKTPNRKEKEASKLPASTRFGNAIAALYRQFVMAEEKRDKLTEKEAQDLIAKYFVKPEEKKAEKKD